MTIGKMIFWTVMIVFLGVPILGFLMLKFVLPSTDGSSSLGPSSPFGYALHVDTQKQINKDIWGDIFN